MYKKDFDSWNKVKKEIDLDSKYGSFRSGEVRWMSFGVNIGSEIDGKGGEFLRPGIIVEKLSPDLYLVIPMSTKIKNTLGYRKIEINKNEVCYCLHQVKTLSAKRIFSRMEKLSDDKLKLVKGELKKYLRL